MLTPRPPSLRQVSALFFGLDLVLWGQASAGAVPVPGRQRKRSAWAGEHAGTTVRASRLERVSRSGLVHLILKWT